MPRIYESQASSCRLPPQRVVKGRRLYTYKFVGGDGECRNIANTDSIYGVAIKNLHVAIPTPSYNASHCYLHRLLFTLSLCLFKTIFYTYAITRDDYKFQSSFYLLCNSFFTLLKTFMSYIFGFLTITSLPLE